MGSKFGFLLYDGFEDLDFFGPWQMVAQWSKVHNGPEELLVISENGQTATSIKGLTVQTNAKLDEVPQLDYLLVPGGTGVHEQVKNPKVVEFIQNQAKNVSYLLSVCTGIFLLQKAGLLKNKNVTTYWAAADKIREDADIHVLDKRYVNDGNLWTAAGISSGIDMILEFIANVAGQEVAAAIQHHAEYYPDGKIYTTETDILPKYVKQA